MEIYSILLLALLIPIIVSNFGSNKAHENSTKPNAPTNLSYSIPSNNTACLIWQDNSSNEIGFKIERRMGNNGAWFELTSTNPNVNTYFDKTIISDSTYRYRVYAFNENGSSQFSEEIYVVVKTPSTL